MKDWAEYRLEKVVSVKIRGTTRETQTDLKTDPQQCTDLSRGGWGQQGQQTGHFKRWGGGAGGSAVAAAYLLHSWLCVCACKGDTCLLHLFSIH